MRSSLEGVDWALLELDVFDAIEGLVVGERHLVVLLEDCTQRVVDDKAAVGILVVVELHDHDSVVLLVDPLDRSGNGGWSLSASAQQKQYDECNNVLLALHGFPIYRGRINIL